MQKLTSRSSSTIEESIVFLRELTTLLNDLNIEYRLGTGALLGAVRSQDLIPWDWDIGLDVDSRVLRSCSDALSSHLQSRGFRDIKIKRTALNIKIEFTKGETDFELMGWRKDFFGNRRRKRLWMPKSLWFDLGVAKLRNSNFITYGSPEKYLENFYGRDWLVPNKTADKSEYFTRKSRRRDFLDLFLSILMLKHRN